MGNSQDFRFLTFNGYISQNSRAATLNVGTIVSIMSKVYVLLALLSGYKKAEVFPSPRLSFAYKKAKM
ncbi:hypothetical protein [Haemophilus haemolyticus]|uniref:hypothetical protein n=1 Tax=Haemophilus haemolyticus TaxID=726 RepID=UPI001EFEBC5F|nr:hypothetical protein [Haemophilus haemolyticus]